MSTKNDCSLKDTAILRDLILQNPGLPLLMFCGEDSYTDEYPYTMAYCTKGEIENLILYDDMWLNEEDYGEKLYDNLSDEEEYKDLSKEEYDKVIDEKVSEAEFVKAIVIWIG